MPLLRSFQAGNRRAFPDYGSATTSFEVEDYLCRLPKVAQEQQPWALIQNLFEVFRVRTRRVLNGGERCFKRLKPCLSGWLTKSKFDRGMVDKGMGLFLCQPFLYRFRSLSVLMGR
jgi:hypothetical protein